MTYLYLLKYISLKLYIYFTFNVNLTVCEVKLNVDKVNNSVNEKL